MDGVDDEAGGSLWTAAFCIANFTQRYDTNDIRQRIVAAER